MKFLLECTYPVKIILNDHGEIPSNTTQQELNLFGDLARKFEMSRVESNK